MFTGTISELFPMSTKSEPKISVKEYRLWAWAKSEQSAICKAIKGLKFTISRDKANNFLVVKSASPRVESAIKEVMKEINCPYGKSDLYPTALTDELTDEAWEMELEYRAQGY